MTAVSENSRWVSTDGQEFTVIAQITLDGQTWVHYRNSQTGQTYSCWLASFLDRFRENVNRS